MKPLNLIYIHSHDTGRYIQPFGYAIPTPNLQRLAEQGVLFRQMHCAAPTCSPSRAALLTGQWAHNNGMFGLAHRGFTLNDYSHLLSRVLHDLGYTTALAGVQHVARSPFVEPTEVMGYDRWLNKELDGRGEPVEDKVVSGVEHFFSNPPKQPFFLDVGFQKTHRIQDGFTRAPRPRHEGDPRYVRPPAPLPDTPETRRDMADFITSAGDLDRDIGCVLAALERSGLADNTLILCTTDHGIAFPGMKCSLTDHGTGVHLIMSGPKGFDGGRVIDAMVSQIDVFPTLCEALGIDKPDWLQGRSMMPLIRGETQEINEEIFAEVTHHAAYEPKRAVRTRRWKYIRRFGGRALPVLPNTDDSPSKSLWADADWAHRPQAAEMLFDLRFDPNEVNNLADDVEHAEVLADMRRRLDDWMQRTGDPLLKGDIPVPSGGYTTPVDDYSPNGAGSPDAARFIP